MLAATGVDCVEASCAGQTGAGGVICCQTALSDCSLFSPGECGVTTCTNNICEATKDTSLCPATIGECGEFLGTCNGLVGTGFTCNKVGINSQCNCGDKCGGSFSCVSLSWDADESESCNSCDTCSGAGPGSTTIGVASCS